MPTISTYPKNAFFLGVANVKIHKSELVWNLMIDDNFVLNKQTNFDKFEKSPYLNLTIASFTNNHLW